MATNPQHQMTVDEFLKRYEGSPPGRYELVDGNVVTLAAETVRHNRVKGKAYLALSQAINNAGLPCEVFTDGVTVMVDQYTAREPDAAVQCGKAADPDGLLLDRPLIVVEVIPPSSERDDTGRKLVEYFSLPSVHHYVVIDPWKELVLHHQRGDSNKILTTILRSGAIEFIPPGFAFQVNALLGKS